MRQLTLLLVGTIAACTHPATNVCDAPPQVDPLESARGKCQFAAGALVKDTLGISDAERAAIPITHVVVVMQENRSFDHYFGHLADAGQPAAEAEPATFSNPDADGGIVTNFHLTSSCLPADPQHQWAAMQEGFDNGKMDGFVLSASIDGLGQTDGHFVMGYYDQSDLPLYYWLADTFAISDRYFGAALGGTWTNRDYLYAGTSDGVMNTGDATLSAPNIFDALTAAGVGWGSYSDGTPRQDCLGWTATHPGVGLFQDFLNGLRSGTLPPVAFVDPGPAQDEHPPNNIHNGELWASQIYQAAVASPLWEHLAIVYTYDESGGLADHVPPPPACLASPDQAAFNNLGMRVPFTVISPWARSHFVSHRVHSHTSVLRFIELLHNLPALTGRDANSDALLDLFNFDCEALKKPPEAPQPPYALCQ
jgi:phospholipase C